VEGSREHGNEPLGSLKCWEFLEWLHNWQLLKKGSAPCMSEYEKTGLRGPKSSILNRTGKGQIRSLFMLCTSC
jgi:hypothetical protein